MRHGNNTVYNTDCIHSEYVHHGSTFPGQHHRSHAHPLHQHTRWKRSRWCRLAESSQTCPQSAQVKRSECIPRPPRTVTAAAHLFPINQWLQGNCNGTNQHVLLAVAFATTKHGDLKNIHPLRTKRHHTATYIARLPSVFHPLAHPHGHL
jgi:hypothetical protein